MAGLAVVALLAASAHIAAAQHSNDDSPDPAQSAPADPWLGTGAASFYWHNEYHGCLAMASYGDYATTCKAKFTPETLQRQYPGNNNNPFEVVGTWGPTEKYKSEGFMVKVPEMNKILMVFKGQYGWQNYNATLGPLLGVGCDRTCKAHTGAMEAWAEVKAATNDMAAIKSNQGQLVWSASGHGFGGMIMQVAALDLKSRNLLFSAQSFGSPPVFNVAAARRWDALFEGDASQRTVSNSDSIPAAIPYHNKYMPDGTLSDSEYAFVNTGIHVWTNSSVQDSPLGTRNMYGQDYNVCIGNREDARCAGGDNEEDHYYYFTPLGHCCEGDWDRDHGDHQNRQELLADQAAYSSTATAPLPMTPPSYNGTMPTPTSISSTAESSTAAAGPTSSDVDGSNAAAAQESNAVAAPAKDGAAASSFDRGVVSTLVAGVFAAIVIGVAV